MNRPAHPVRFVIFLRTLMMAIVTSYHTEKCCRHSGECTWSVHSTIKQSVSASHHSHVNEKACINCNLIQKLWWLIRYLLRSVVVCPLKVILVLHFLN